MAAEIILKVKVDRSEYNRFKSEAQQGVSFKISTNGASKASQDVNGVSNSTQNLGKQVNDATIKLQSLGNMLTKKIAWYSISMAISSVTTAFKNAFTEIKNVDTQLTNIAKVSGQSIEQLGSLAEKAYSTASKYGVAASDYMEAVYEYTKAGFKENADVMGELSTKAMLVGDTTASVADKFLVAANAAWDYSQNVEELSLLVDKADYINNNYATTFEKIADGFPRVASVASMAGMSAEQTMAALGTITATTQETASRAGTALRALILNILGDTSTEVEEGVTTTQEEIDSLRKVLEVYASDVVEAADATGTLINPMEALAELSKAYQKGVLTEKGLFEIESALGGKLRTNQLDALLKNFDMYQEMMTGMAGAFGTADKEIETMLGSWESKSNILKNTWTEFISKTVNSKFFKNIIDDVTELLDKFDNIGTLLPSIIGLFGALFAPSIASSIGNTVLSLKNLVSMVKNLGDTTNKTAFTTEQKVSAIGTGLSLALTAFTIAYTVYENNIREILHNAETLAEEAKTESQAAQASIDNIIGLYEAYETSKDAYKEGIGTKEDYETATENLTTALGLEKNAIDEITDSIKNLKELEDMEAAVSKAGQSALNAADVYQGGKYTSANYNPIIAAGQKYTSDYTYEDYINSIIPNSWSEFFGIPEGQDIIPSSLEELMNRSGVKEWTGTAGIAQLPELVSMTDEERLQKMALSYRTYDSQLKALNAAYNAKSYNDVQNAYLSRNINSNQATMAGKYLQTLTQEQIREEINKVQGYLDEAYFVEPYIEQIDAEREYQKKLDDMLSGGETTIEEVIEAKEKYTLASEAAAEAVLAEVVAQMKVAEAYKEVMGNAISATEAIQKYQDTLDANTTEEEADAVVEAYKTGFEAYAKGIKDSPEISALADLLLGEDVVNEIRARGENVADALMQNENFKRIFIEGYDDDNEPVFRESVDAAKELANIIQEFDTDSNNLITSQGEIAAQLYETDEGVKIVVEDWELLGDAMGMNSDMLKIMLQMYGFLTPGLEASTADMLAFAEAIGATYETAEGLKRVDLGKVVEEAFANGATTDEVWNLVDALQEADKAGDIELVIDDDQVRLADESTRKLIGELDKTEITRVIRIDQSDIQDIQTKIGYINADLEALAKKDVSVAVTLKYSQMGLGTSGLPDLLSGAYEASASGTDNAEGGATLVNEEGAEIIAANGKAWVAGGGKPTITNVPKGAKVWTAGETKAILGNSDVSELFGGIEARASGTPSVISSIARTTSGGAANFGADVSENQHLQNLKDMVSLRKSELDLIEASGGSINAQMKKQEGIQAALVEEIKYLQQIGGKQEDINALATEWYQTQEAIANLQKSISESELYENLQAAVKARIDDLNDKRDAELEKIDTKIARLKEEHDIQEDTNELQEKQLAVEEARAALANAKRQRTVRVFNAATGRWEWTYDAATVQSASDAYLSAKQELKDYNANQSYESKIASLEAKQAAITEKYSDQISKWQVVIDAMEEPVQSIKSSLNAIEKHATAEMLPTIKKINEALEELGKGGINTSKLYDSGGILKGIGGIKATAADEMILPPDITSKMLSPVSSQMFSRRMGELRYLYGMNGGLSGYSNSSIGAQYNGDTYTFGNITLSKEQARSTTVYELARMSRGLRSYSSAM